MSLMDLKSRAQCFPLSVIHNNAVKQMQDVYSLTFLLVILYFTVQKTNTFV